MQYNVGRIPPARLAELHQPPRRSINVATPDFLNFVGTPIGGRSLRPGELLKVSLITFEAITNRIDRVEQLGLVERHREPNDRHGVVVRLTPSGRKLADRAIAVHFENMNHMFSGLDEKELKLASGLLAKLLGCFEEQSVNPIVLVKTGVPPPRSIRRNPATEAKRLSR